MATGKCEWAKRVSGAGPAMRRFGGYNASGSASSVQLTRNTQEIHAQAFSRIALSPDDRALRFAAARRPAIRQTYSQKIEDRRQKENQHDDQDRADSLGPDDDYSWYLKHDRVHQFRPQ